MPDNLLVEIMRFRTRPRRNYELPLQVRCYMSLVGRACEIRIECTVAGTYYTKLNEVHCEDIQIRFPLPDVWVYLFRVEKRFRYGAVHSSKHKFGKIKGLDRFMVHKGQNQGALMEASCGMAKYEQAFKSVVWRIEQLPVKNKVWCHFCKKTHHFVHKQLFKLGQGFTRTDRPCKRPVVACPKQSMQGKYTSCLTKGCGWETSSSLLVCFSFQLVEP